MPQEFFLEYDIAELLRHAARLMTHQQYKKFIRTMWEIFYQNETK